MNRERAGFHLPFFYFLNKKWSQYVYLFSQKCFGYRAKNVQLQPYYRLFQGWLLPHWPYRSWAPHYLRHYDKTLSRVHKSAGEWFINTQPPFSIPRSKTGWPLVLMCIALARRLREWVRTASNSRSLSRKNPRSYTTWGTENFLLRNRGRGSTPRKRLTLHSLYMYPSDCELSAKGVRPLLPSTMRGKRTFVWRYRKINGSRVKHSCLFFSEKSLNKPFLSRQMYTGFTRYLVFWNPRKTKRRHRESYFTEPQR